MVKKPATPTKQATPAAAPAPAKTDPKSFDAGAFARALQGMAAKKDLDGLATYLGWLKHAEFSDANVRAVGEALGVAVGDAAKKAALPKIGNVLYKPFGTTFAKQHSAAAMLERAKRIADAQAAQQAAQKEAKPKAKKGKGKQAASEAKEKTTKKTASKKAGKKAAKKKATVKKPAAKKPAAKKKPAKRKK